VPPPEQNTGNDIPSHPSTIVADSATDDPQQYANVPAANDGTLSQTKPPSAFHRFTSRHKTSIVFFVLVLLDLIITPTIILVAPHLGAVGFVLVWFLLLSIPGGIVCLLAGIITFVSELIHKQ
jgi:hypothetical protein